ncbi:ABC transporter permease [Massilia rubra]|uniref:ABC transporter permease n=1 Tax=Massilia rubra TaxID=2607910 RepID=A0ABX0LPI4_9BURK|nr:FtsX-like permease family protein [Massilia rubra]NHZ33364.1 ABC transporter permease [Massilia rubra]
MSALALAARNVWRNGRRSLSTFLTMTVGVCALLLLGAYVQTVDQGLQTNFVRHGGHLEIQHRDFLLYGDGNPAAYGLADYQRIIDAVRSDPQLRAQVLVITPSLRLGGIAGNASANVSRTVFGRGTLVDDQNRMRAWNAYGLPIKPGNLALQGSPPNAAVIGTGVARVLRLCGALAVPDCPPPVEAGAAGGAAQPAGLAALSELSQPAKRTAMDAAVPVIQLLTAGETGAPNVADLNVVKAQSQGVKELDDGWIELHLARAQRLVYGEAAPRATSLVVQLDTTANLAAARERIAAILARDFKGEQLTVLGFDTINPSYGQILGMFGALFGFVALLFSCVVLFSVANSVNMAVAERTVEIGTLRAIGMQRGAIAAVFVWEALLLGLACAVAGLLLALGIAYAVNHAGMSWLPPGTVEPQVISVGLWGEYKIIANAVLTLLIVSLLAAWWPARRAGRLPIVDSLRHV